MELRHLEQVVAIAEHRGFSGAARYLSLSQSTLSKSIARLEGQLGVQLFTRDSGAARPTAYGEFLIARGQTVLRGVRDLTEDFDRLVHGEEGLLKIGVGAAAKLALLNQIVSGLAEQFPDLAIHTTHDHASRLARDMSHGRFDAVFAHYEAATLYDDLVRVRVISSPFTAFARPGHPAVRGHPLTPAELLEHRIASCWPGSAYLEWIGPVEGLQANHLNGFRSDSYWQIRDRVLHDDFLAVAPSFIFHADVQKGQLVEVPLTWDGVYECWMLTSRARWATPEIKALAEIAKAAGRKLTPLAPAPEPEPAEAVMALAAPRFGRDAPPMNQAVDVLAVRAS
jgi:DNA-binding transcriptional LysR family regulator